LLAAGAAVTLPASNIVRRGRLMIRALSLTLVAVLCLGAAPESRLEQYFRLRKEAGTAIAAQDLAKAEGLLEQALALYPTSSGSLIRLARVEVAAGKRGEAIAHLKAYAALDLTWDVAGDAALAPLAVDKAFAPVAARLKANAEPVGEVSVLTEIRPADQVVEGLVWRGGGWFVGSVSGRRILQIAGETAPFPTDGQKVGAIFGMASQSDGSDEAYIWAAEADGPGIPGSTGPAATALLKFDFFSGALLARYPVPDDGRRHQLGDVMVTEAGDVFASDSVGANLYRLRKGAAGLELLLASNELGSPQGLASCGEGALLVADYSTGLHRLDLATGRLEAVGGRPVALAGIDGLIGIRDWKSGGRWPMTYVVTQNGVTPARLLQLTLSPDCRRITGAVTLAANLPELEDITLAAQLLDGVAFVGGSGWASVDGDGKTVPGAPGPSPRIYHVALR
jgi:tetratricopeptide (TPR) repeat protein